MILELYATLFIISIALLFLGYYTKIDTIKILSFGIIFVLGVVLFGYGDTLQYQIGKSNIYEYGNNFTGEHWDYSASSIPSGAKTGEFLFHIEEHYSYQTYTNNLLGFLMSTLAFLGWLSVYFDYKTRSD